MTVAERKAAVERDLQQAQQQAQLYTQQATQWTQRVLYLQGKLDLLTELAQPDEARAPEPGEKVLVSPDGSALP